MKKESGVLLFFFPSSSFVTRLFIKGRSRGRKVGEEVKRFISHASTLLGVARAGAGDGGGGGGDGGGGGSVAKSVCCSGYHSSSSSSSGDAPRIIDSNGGVGLHENI